MAKLSDVELREVALAIKTKISLLEPSDCAPDLHKRIMAERISALFSALGKLTEEEGV